MLLSRPNTRSIQKTSGIALLTPLGYILVLFAMRLAPISHVAPLREMSNDDWHICWSRVLREGEIVRRVMGAALVAGGVAALALG